MDKQQARDIVRDTLGKPFVKEAFARLVKELFNQIDESKAFHARGYVPESYKKYVKTYERIATYTDSDGLKIDILIVYLQSETTLERARTSQRNFIAHYLKDRDQKDAGLVAFVSPDPSDWRFSLVKMDYRFEEEKNSKVKVKEEFTPARRWSFLVGTNENSHTAQSRLAPLITDDTHNPVLADLEEAFNIETVTKEFFTEYRNLFLRVKEALDVIVAKDATIKNNFEQNGVNTVDFAKKLLGQIVFLYFLQKKGWFGVARDAAWGTGSKQFLRELFEQKHGSFKNFFNDILEPLFYEALRLDRGHEDHYYSRFNCKIPFLNGGLFDPINGYDWVKTDILISNELFSNKSITNKGDTGDGILDVFDRYNFTVKEDEPLEKEVAIDPELLGKAYEKFNAIRPDNFDEFQKALKSGKKGEESKFNKQFGVYYTPREIVHYMCQQSLINYLFSQLNGGMVTYEKPGVRQTDLLGNTGKKGQLDLTIEHRERPAIPKADIETLIHYGERMSDNEEMALIKQKKINDGQQKTSDYKLQLSASIRNNAKEIDDKLTSIKVCDPAIGSGAFPVGMMSEIVRARNTLSTFIKNTDRSVYHFKRNCIENSLYGVDIDSGAVEIAKLRLWLSLVVDEDDIRQIKPLPNLDYKIVCGNSLLGLPADILPDVAISKEIEEKKKQYFSTTSPSEKNKIRETINGLFSQLMDNIKKYDPTIADISFDFHTHFSEVFHENGGFDVVIGNPPYIGQSGHREIFREVLNSSFGKAYHQRRMDYFYFFFHRAILLAKNNTGLINYISTNYYFNATYADKLRLHMFKNCRFIKLINFNEAKIFESATGQHNAITILVKNSSFNGFVDTLITKRKNFISSNIIKSILDGFDDETEYYKYPSINIFDGVKNYVRIEGRLDQNNNYENPFNSILSKLSEGNPSINEMFDIFQGIVTGANDLSKNNKIKYSINDKEGAGIFIINDEELKRLKLTSFEKKYIKPWYKNSDIYRWHCTEKNKKYLVYLTSTDQIEDTQIPNLVEHFKKYKHLLINRNIRSGSYSIEQYHQFVKGVIDIPYVMIKSTFKTGRYFCVSYARDKHIFESPKIVCPQRSPLNTFGYSENPWFAASDVYYILPKDNSELALKYLLALLNSRLYFFRLYFKGQRKGEILQLFKDPLSEITIKKISKDEQNKFVLLVDTILSLTQSDDYMQNQTKQVKVKEYEKEIDQMVYALYCLTDEEIKIVEGGQ
jgi:hypothetical protein